MPVSLALILLVLLAAAAAWWWRQVIVVPARTLEKAARALATGRRTDGAALQSMTGPLHPAALALALAADRVGALSAQREGEATSLRVILESLTEGVLAVDSARTVLLANERLKEMFDLRAPAVGRNVSETLRAPEVRAAVDAALGGETSVRPIALDVRGADGRYATKHFDLAAAPFAVAGGGAAGAVLVFHDVTALRQLEAVRREFVANVSHELRTPLTLIRGHLETLREEGALEDRALAERSLGVMHKHALRLGALVEDLLTISRLEHGHGGLEIERVPLGEAAARVLERLDSGEKGAPCEVDIAPVGLAVRADPHRLDQVLFNLLDNALRHGSAGGAPLVRIEARRAGGFVRLTVSDNGPGIPASDQAHVWERFYRVHKDRSRDAGGTGLGLSIVKHIALAHGGRVGLESELGHGALFHVWLPAAEAAENGAA